MVGVSHSGWDSVTVFVDASVNLGLEIDADVNVEVGKKVFGKCQHIGSKTVGLKVPASGLNALGVNMTAFNASVVCAGGRTPLCIGGKLELVSPAAPASEHAPTFAGAQQTIRFCNPRCDF